MHHYFQGMSLLIINNAVILTVINIDFSSYLVIFILIYHLSSPEDLTLLSAETETLCFWKTIPRTFVNVP